MSINISPASSNGRSDNSQDSVRTRDIKNIKDISLSSINTQDQHTPRDLISFYSPEEYIEKHRETISLPMPQSPDSYQDFREPSRRESSGMFKKNTREEDEDKYVKIVEGLEVQKCEDTESALPGKKILFSSTGDNSSVLRKEDHLNRIICEQDRLDLDKSVISKVDFFRRKSLVRHQR